MFDAINLKAVAAIPAHDSPLAALAFSNSGNKLASASNTVSGHERCLYGEMGEPINLPR